MEEKVKSNEVQDKIKQDAINLIKPIFKRYNATDKENTMTKEEVLAEIEDKNEQKYFNYLTKLDIIQKVKGRYYYNAENEKNIKTKSSVAKTLAIAIIVILVIVGILLVLGKSAPEVTTISNDDISFEIGTDWTTWAEYDEQYGWSYFKYISGIPATENNEIVNELDYSIYPAIISVSYDRENTGEYSSLDDLKNVLETYILGDLLPEEYNINMVVTEKGYSALRTKIKFTSEPQEIDYYYYIYNDGKLAYVSGITYNMDDEDELEQTIIDIVNSFEWKK